MNQAKLCWNCRAAVSSSVKECPACYAGLDPEARGLSPELAAEEQRRLRTASQNLTRPPDELGCVASIGLILAGSLTAALIAGTVGNIVDSQPCTGSVSDCGEYVGITRGFWVFLLAAPIVSSVYIWLAGQSLEDKRRSYERSTSQRSSD